jgi:hypothetical protein
MQARTKVGLIVGAIGLVLNICVAGFVGICGPLVSLIAGGVAGFFTAQQEKLATKSDGGRAGAVSGAIAGGLIILGQIIGGVGALAFMQNSGTTPLVGSVPDVSADPSFQAIYYATGLGTALCFGIIGAGLAAGAGYGGGYFATSDQPPADSTPSSISM